MPMRSLSVPGIVGDAYSHEQQPVDNIRQEKRIDTVVSNLVGNPGKIQSDDQIVTYVIRGNEAHALPIHAKPKLRTILPGGHISQQGKKALAKTWASLIPLEIQVIEEIIWNDRQSTFGPYPCGNYRRIATGILETSGKGSCSLCSRSTLAYAHATITFIPLPVSRAQGEARSSQSIGSHHGLGTRAT